MFKNILLATKLSPRAGTARDVSVELAKALNAKIYVLTVYNYDFVNRADFDITTIADDLKDRVRQNIEKKFDNYLMTFKEQGIEPVKILKVGNPETEILDTAREIHADLIILGAGTTKGILLDRFVQNVADKVRKRASCHVLTIT